MNLVTNDRILIFHSNYPFNSEYVFPILKCNHFCQLSPS